MADDPKKKPAGEADDKGKKKPPFKPGGKGEGGNAKPRPKAAPFGGGGEPDDDEMGGMTGGGGGDPLGGDPLGGAAPGPPMDDAALLAMLSQGAGPGGGGPSPFGGGMPQGPGGPGGLPFGGSMQGQPPSDSPLLMALQGQMGGGGMPGQLQSGPPPAAMGLVQLLHALALTQNGVAPGGSGVPHDSPNPGFMQGVGGGMGGGY